MCCHEAPVQHELKCCWVQVYHYKDVHEIVVQIPQCALWCCTVDKLVRWQCQHARTCNLRSTHECIRGQEFAWNRRLWVSFAFCCQFGSSGSQHFFDYLPLNNHCDTGQKEYLSLAPGFSIYACSKRFYILDCAVNVSLSIVKACKSKWCSNNTHPHNNQPYSLNLW
jgi:hypothetical protein